jgi:ADP-ribosylglycohydrolase
MNNQTSLKDKFHGCIAGAQIGAAMGAPVAGWSYRDIETKYGTLDRLLPYERNNNGVRMEPGSPDDGVERQKLILKAIIEKADRVDAEDVRAVWVRDTNPATATIISEPFEANLLAVAASGIPSRDIGKYCDYAGISSAARSCHPIGLINAGDVRSAVHDAFEIGQLYHVSKSYSIRWAGVTAAAIASATKPGATADSVIGDIFRYCDYSDLACKIDGSKHGYLRDNVIEELDAGLKKTASCRDFRELRSVFDTIYHGSGVPYGYQFANEALTKAVCIFRLAGGNVNDAIIAGANMGRDSAGVASIAGGLAGALGGTSALSPKWIAQVDQATAANHASSLNATIREQAEGLYQAFRSRLRKIDGFVEQMLP